MSQFYTKRFSSKVSQPLSQPNLEEIEQFKKYNALFKLNNRSVVSVTGEDASNFLQSMITNDMKLLNDQIVTIFALFLNPKGRIMFDAMIVKSNLYRFSLILSSDSPVPDFWIDVHNDSKEDLIKHLTSHCLRKKVIIQDLSDMMGVHSACVNFSKLF